jgi:hypothetical protein
MPLSAQPTLAKIPQLSQHSQPHTATCYKVVFRHVFETVTVQYYFNHLNLKYGF